MINTPPRRRTIVNWTFPRNRRKRISGDGDVAIEVLLGLPALPQGEARGGFFFPRLGNLPQPALQKLSHEWLKVA
jgi:hypothetical protein